MRFCFLTTREERKRKKKKDLYMVPRIFVYRGSTNIESGYSCWASEGGKKNSIVSTRIEKKKEPSGILQLAGGEEENSGISLG